MTSLLYQWIDLLWVPVALLAAHPRHRLFAVAFVLACAFTLRLQIELMASIGFEAGFLQLIETPLFNRGLITYSIITAFYLILAYFSPRTSTIVFMAASLSMYVLAFVASMLVMLL